MSQKKTVSREMGKRRFSLKRPMKKIHKVVKKVEKRQKAVSYTTRTDIAGKRITPVHSKMTL